MTLDSVAEFKLSITKALADQLAEALDPLTPSPLTRENLAQVEKRPGVYILFLDGDRVYVGKTAKGLPARLGQHLRKISGRVGLSAERMSFVCVYVDKDMDSVAPERMLIAKYTSRGGVPWNSNGFGNRDPGRRRDQSLVEINHFDAEYPIDLDTLVELPSEHGALLPSEPSVSATLATLKRVLPFNLRYDRTAEGKSITNSHFVTIPPTATTFRDVIEAILDALPPGWQATALPGYAILYREKAHYQSATGWWRKTEDGGVAWYHGPSQRDLTRAEIPPDEEDETADEDE